MPGGCLGFLNYQQYHCKGKILEYSQHSCNFLAMFTTCLGRILYLKNRGSEYLVYPTEETIGYPTTLEKCNFLVGDSMGWFPGDLFSRAKRQPKWRLKDFCSFQSTGGVVALRPKRSENMCGMCFRFFLRIYEKGAQAILRRISPQPPSYWHSIDNRGFRGFARRKNLELHWSYHGRWWEHKNSLNIHIQKLKAGVHSLRLTWLAQNSSSILESFQLTV